MLVTEWFEERIVLVLRMSIRVNSFKVNDMVVCTDYSWERLIVFSKKNQKIKQLEVISLIQPLSKMHSIHCKRFRISHQPIKTSCGKPRNRTNLSLNNWAQGAQ